MPRRCRAAVAVARIAEHVEHRGAYSIERLVQLDAYATRTSNIRVAAVLVLTLVPSAVIALGIEMIPLRDPKDGLQHSSMFWLRAFLFTAVAEVVLLEQCRHLIPRWPMTTVQLVASAVVGAIGTTGAMFLVARAVGFPAPFSIACGSPVCFGLLTVCVTVVCGKFLATNPPGRAALWRYLAVMTIQVIMTYVYNLYGFVFVHLATRGQIVAAVLALAIKVIMKRWIAFVYREQDDLRPETVVFNAEMYHALFISWCLQSSGSRYSTAAFVAVDFLEAALKIHAAERMRMEIYRAVHRVTTARASGAKKIDPTLTDRPLPPLLDLAVGLWQVHPIVYADPIPIESSVQQCRGSSGLSSVAVGPTPFFHTTTASAWPSMRSVGSPETQTSHSNSIVPTQATIRNCAPLAKTRSTWVVIPSRLAPKRDDAARLIQDMSDDDRRLILAHTLKLLHSIEFALLIEFIEVIVSVLYCTCANTRVVCYPDIKCLSV